MNPGWASRDCSRAGSSARRSRLARRTAQHTPKGGERARGARAVASRVEIAPTSAASASSFNDPICGAGLTRAGVGIVASSRSRHPRPSPIRRARHGVACDQRRAHARKWRDASHLALRSGMQAPSTTMIETVAACSGRGASAIAPRGACGPTASSNAPSSSSGADATVRCRVTTPSKDDRRPQHAGGSCEVSVIEAPHPAWLGHAAISQGVGHKRRPLGDADTPGRVHHERGLGAERGDLEEGRSPAQAAGRCCGCTRRQRVRCEPAGCIWCRPRPARALAAGARAVSAVRG